jgi:hypothetical protein
MVPEIDFAFLGSCVTGGALASVSDTSLVNSKNRDHLTEDSHSDLSLGLRKHKPNPVLNSSRKKGNSKAGQ